MTLHEHMLICLADELLIFSQDKLLTGPYWGEMQAAGCEI